MQGTSEAEVFKWWQWLVSAAGGALVTLVAFRTNIALMNRRIDDRKKEIADMEAKFSRRMEEVEEAINIRLGAIERKQSLQLQIIADIARKVGADSRFSDVIVQYLSEEARDRHEGGGGARRGD